MPRPWTVVGFTGHRHLDAPGPVASAISAVLDRLNCAHPGRLAAVASIASGADTLFASAALARSLPWFALLPLARSEFRRDFEPAQWAEAEALLARAASVQTGPPTDGRDEAYLECGLRTVDESDLLLAVWDGQPAAGTGGTAEIVDYARRLGRPLIWIHSETGTATEERLERMPADVSEPLTATTEPTGRAAVDSMFTEFDTAALRHAPAAKHLTAVVILLHLVASGVAVLGLMLALTGGPAYFVAGFKMACLGASLWLVFRHRHAHHGWMHTRISAEICRSALATWALPDPETSFPKTRVPGFERLQRALRLERLADRSPPPSLERAREDYLEKRVRDQVRYFSRQLSRLAPRHRWMKSTASLCTSAAIVLGFVVLAFGLLHIQGPVTTGAKALSLTLPLLNAAILSFVASHDIGRRVSRFDELVRTLEAIALRMTYVRSWSSLERIAIEAETAILQEALEWHSVSRFAAGGH